MVKPDSYQHYLDNYLADVAAAAVQFEDVLKEQTKALQQIIEQQKDQSEQAEVDSVETGSARGGPAGAGSVETGTAGAGVVGGSLGEVQIRRKAGQPSIFD